MSRESLVSKHPSPNPPVIPGPDPESIQICGNPTPPVIPGPDPESIQISSYFINPKLREYIFSLDKQTVSKFTRLTDLLEIFEKKLGMPYSKQILKNLYELRIRGQQEVRVFYCFHQNKTVFVHAFVKKTQKTPQSDLKTAIAKVKLLTNT